MKALTLTGTLRRNYGAYTEWIETPHGAYPKWHRQPFVYLQLQDDGTYERFEEAKRPKDNYLTFYSSQAADDFLKVNTGELKTYPRKVYTNKNWKKK